MKNDPLDIDPAQLLPHRGPARFLSEFVEVGEDEIACRGSIPSGSPYVQGGTISSFVLLELAAQCAAVLESLEGARRGVTVDSRSGYLVRARGLIATTTRQPAETTFDVRVRRTGRAGELGMYETEVSIGGTAVLSGAFSTFVPTTPGPSTAD